MDHTIVGLGEILWDVFEDYRRPGGAPANVAYHANILGGSGVIASRTGKDSDGKELEKFLQKKNIPVDHIQKDENHPTGKVTVTMNDQEASYIIHEPAAWDFMDLTDQWKTLANKADAICFGTLAQRNKHSRATIQEFIRHASPECLKILDLNLRTPHYSKDVIAESISLCNIIKLNEHEYSELPGLLQAPKSSKDLLLEDFEVDAICLTKGSKGCEIITANSHFIAAPIRVDVSQGDTVGVGDAFTAALTHGKLQGKKWEEILHTSNYYAAQMVALKGAMPDVTKEITDSVQ